MCKLEFIQLDLQMKETIGSHFETYLTTQKACKLTLQNKLQKNTDKNHVHKEKKKTTRLSTRTKVSKQPWVEQLTHTYHTFGMLNLVRKSHLLNGS